jgi:glyoxylase-like metal-dependent hydrolase (beta-lactamase superfamily II)
MNTYMLQRRHFLQMTAAGLAAPALTVQAAQPAALQWTHFPADEHGFSRAPVLLSGAQEAILVDGGFTLSDGRAVAQAIAATGKTLKAIYISQSDPDYYFSLAPIREAFPKAQILAASQTIAAIAANVDKKLAVWGPQLKDNGPQTRADVVFAQPFDESVLMLEGQRIEIVAAQGMANRRYLWVPSLQAIVGGVLVFSDLHVWTADTPSADARRAWRDNLEAMLARKPQRVVPGHMGPQAVLDASAIRFTRDYLLAFEAALAQASNSGQLIASMLQRYPQLQGKTSLEIGAKVALGEMAWG